MVSNATFNVFELRTAQDLLAKLECDLIRLHSNSLDSDAAFDFFVTAYHMLDWLYPGDANKKRRKDLEDGEILLQIASHLANGSKHFELNAPKHKSVKGTTREDGGPQTRGGNRCWDHRGASSRHS